jgi:hypothetical protein
MVNPAGCSAWNTAAADRRGFPGQALAAYRPGAASRTAAIPARRRARLLHQRHLNHLGPPLGQLDLRQIRLRPVKPLARARADVADHGAVAEEPHVALDRADERVTAPLRPRDHALADELPDPARADAEKPGNRLDRVVRGGR